MNKSTIAHYPDLDTALNALKSDAIDHTSSRVVITRDEEKKVVVKIEDQPIKKISLVSLFDLAW